MQNIRQITPVPLLQGIQRNPYVLGDGVWTGEIGLLSVGWGSVGDHVVVVSNKEAALLDRELRLDLG